ncbi:15578_t:CDS:2 [Cetraspora pellucida]|uniref:15578_t:CDS:1 n=1 Tax=Cetraspora pellucida TaxID=1433469 RepID=A0A9N9ISC7_9GLOM|nr:15578_t:CDS:2 [Cetraspora pellucida]
MEDLNDNFVSNNFMSNNSVSNNSVSNNSVSNNSTNSDNSVSNNSMSNNSVSNNSTNSDNSQHTTSCPYFPICESQNNKSRLIKPIMKDEMNNSIIDLVVGTGISFNILDNPLFHNMLGQTAQAIKSVLLKTLEDYNIKEKLFGLIMNNTMTNKAPFESAMLVFSKDHSNSISDAITVILEISQHLKKININNMTHLMIKKFEKYWNKIIDHIIIAHILDSRYKFEHLKATFIEVGKYSDSNAEQFIDNIRQKIILYGRKYINIQSPPTTNSINESPLTTNIINELLPTTQVNDNNSASNLLFSPRRISKKYNTNTIEYELELYEKDPPEEGNNGVLIWNSLSKKFPILSRMAHDYFSIQPSSVASERAFLRAGFTITNDRAKIE